MKVYKSWGTHLPVLIKLVNMTSGDILELGTGLYSTPFLHWSCYSTKRKLVSYDTNVQYIKYMGEYADTFHEVSLVKDWDDVNIEKSWDIVLVDQHPDSSRAKTAVRVANFAKYVVLHDSDLCNDLAYKYNEIYPLFKYRFDFKEVSPNTTILSNFVDLTDFKI